MLKKNVTVAPKQRGSHDTAPLHFPRWVTCLVTRAHLHRASFQRPRHRPWRAIGDRVPEDLRALAALPGALQARAQQLPQPVHGAGSDHRQGAAGKGQNMWYEHSTAFPVILWPKLGDLVSIAIQIATNMLAVLIPTLVDSLLRIVNIKRKFAGTEPIICWNRANSKFGRIENYQQLYSNFIRVSMSRMCFSASNRISHSWNFGTNSYFTNLSLITLSDFASTAG